MLVKPGENLVSFKVILILIHIYTFATPLNHNDYVRRSNHYIFHSLQAFEFCHLYIYQGKVYFYIFRKNTVDQICLDLNNFICLAFSR